MFKKITFGMILVGSLVMNLVQFNDIKDFRHINSNLQNDINNLESTNNSLTAEIDDLKTERDNLAEENKNLSTELAGIKGGLSKAQEAINNTLNPYNEE